MDKNIPVYKIVVDDTDEMSGVDFISLVNDPAIGVFEGKSLFVAMNESKKLYRFEAQKDKQIVSGPFLIPDLPIYRVDPEMGEFYVVFTADEIEKIAKKFNREAKLKNINLEHTKTTVSAYVAENWLIEDSKIDKSAKYGFDLPAGTWFGSIQIQDSEFWQEFVKTGEVKGFSIEGLLGIALRKIKNKMATEYKVKTNDTWNSFVTEGDAALAVGVAIFYAPSKRLVNGSVVEYSEPVYNGEFLLDNGQLITVAGGVIAAVTQLDETQIAQKQAQMKKTNQKFATAKLKDGSSIMTPDEAWKVGSEVYLVNADGSQGEYAPDGDYELEDGTVVKVAKWLVTEIVAPATQADVTKEEKMAIAPEDATAIQAMIDASLKPLLDRLDALEKAAQADAAEDATEGDMPAEMSKLKEEVTALKAQLSSLPGAKSKTSATDKVLSKVGQEKISTDEQVKRLMELKKNLK